MMLIEAMKKLRLIEKKMNGHCTDITRYASMVSTERPTFENEHVQQLEVEALVIANLDFVKEYLRLKRSIEYTNLVTYIEVSQGNYSISELLVLKRKLAQYVEKTYQALNDSAATQRMRGVVSMLGAEKTPQVIRLYDEAAKNTGLRTWQDFYHEIDSRLEVVNATTELIEEIPLN